MSDPVDISAERVIRCGRRKLAAYAADLSHVPGWYQTIQAVSWQGDPGARLGARAEFMMGFIGQKTPYIYEITEYIPDEKLRMTTRQGPFPMETIYEWSDASRGRTKMRLTNRSWPSGLKAVLMPFMALAMRRAMAKDLKALARLTE